tara:strand:- start:351 stop:662 length:312 start_codon:yes stop_codon:yes gene_type:complete
MPSKNKARGNRLERLVVNLAKEQGIKAIRAYASNGLSLGEAEDVDVKIGEFKGQCKMRKNIASFMKPPESCDIALIKTDREETLVVIRYSDFLEMMLRNMGVL